MIQEEVFGYIIEKYPRLQDISYVNPGRDPNANRYFDARNLIIANRQNIINETIASLGVFSPSGSAVSFNDVGTIVDAVAEDLRDGGNYNTVAAVQGFFANDTTLTGVLAGEEENLLWAFRRARDLCKQAVANLLSVKANLYDPVPFAYSPYNFYSNLPCGSITSGKTGSQAENDGDTTNGVTIDLAIKDAKRYKTTYNLITQNKEYIIDNALAEIAVYDEAPFFSFTGDTVETAKSRFKTAYRLVRRNKEDAQNYAIGQVSTLYPSFVFPGGTDKCKRDIGYFIDAVAMDVFLGGNLWSRTFIDKYFDGTGQWITGGLQGEELQSIAAYNAARDYLQDAVSNQLSYGYQDLTVSTGESIYGDGNGDVSNVVATACADVQNDIASLTSIVTQCISDGNNDSITNSNNANYVTPTERDLLTGASKCRRDI